VFADGGSEVAIGWHADVVHRRQVELDEPLPLRLSDLETAVHGDQVGKAELACERVRAAERLGGEHRQMVDMLRLPCPEQRLQQRVAQHAGVEHVLEAMDRLDPTSELEQRGHRVTSQS
jgi:hypothetical protein